MGHDARVTACRLFPVLLVLGACAVPDRPQAAAPSVGPAPASVPAGEVQAAQDLLQAPPQEWPTRMAGAFEHGERAVAPLVAGMRADPDAPGAQAAIRLLGILGGEAALSFLQQQLQERGRNATEAALALGEARGAMAVPLLLETARDRLADATLRCACVASLVRLGSGREVRGLVRAVVLAGTPAGEPLRLEHGLPQRSRWALERYMLQRALLAASGDDFGFDTDSPWPDLERAAGAIDAWLTAPR